MLCFLIACGNIKVKERWASEKAEILKRSEIILEKKDPETIREINGILDELENDWAVEILSGWIPGGTSEGLLFANKKEVSLLIQKSDVSLPIIFKRISALNTKEIASDHPRRQAMVLYFLVFKETKNPESIPFLIDYIISLPIKEENTWPRHPFCDAINAINKITGKNYDYTNAFDNRFKIADEAEKWYDSRGTVPHN
jgi:hypothetical protein